MNGVRPSQRVGDQLLTLLVAAASANAAAAAFLAHGCAVCSHTETAHDLDRHGRRSRCSVTDGDGRCDCRAWHPLTGTELTT